MISPAACYSNISGGMTNIVLEDAIGISDALMSRDLKLDIYGNFAPYSYKDEELE
jgi:hypothetical protein